MRGTIRLTCLWLVARSGGSLPGTALGGCLAVILWIGAALAQQPSSPSEDAEQAQQPKAEQAQPAPSPEPTPLKQEAAPSDVVENSNTGSEDGNAGTSGEAVPPEQSPAQAEVAPDSSISSPPADVKTKKRNRYPDCEFDNILECDLVAQQSVAKSTFWMNYAAWGGVALTVIGLALLWCTLLYTRSAAEHTRIAASTAQRSVGEAREATAVARAAIAVQSQTAECQLRAYVNILSCNREKLESTQPWKITLVILRWPRKIGQVFKVYSPD